jgi:hypothetical protein
MKKNKKNDTLSKETTQNEVKISQNKKWKLEKNGKKTPLSFVRIWCWSVGLPEAREGKEVPYYLRKQEQHQCKKSSSTNVKKTTIRDWPI